MQTIYLYLVNSHKNAKHFKLKSPKNVKCGHFNVCLMSRNVNAFISQSYHIHTYMRFIHYIVPFAGP